MSRPRVAGCEVECMTHLRATFETVSGGLIEADFTTAPDHSCEWWVGHRCPHGTVFYLHPSAGQMLEWLIRCPE